LKELIVAKNQIRAVTLARSLVEGTTDAADLTDNDWYLLLLAAGMNQASASGSTLCKRVLEAADGGTGFFASITRDRLEAGVREAVADAAGSWDQWVGVQPAVPDLVESGWRQGVAVTTALIRAIVRTAGRGMIGECARHV